jgi:hypothetical protein
VAVQPKSKFFKTYQSRAKPEPNLSKEKAWISLFSLGGIELFQRVALTPRGKKVFFSAPFLAGASNPIAILKGIIDSDFRKEKSTPQEKRRAPRSGSKSTRRGRLRTEFLLDRFGAECREAAADKRLDRARNGSAGPGIPPADVETRFLRDRGYRFGLFAERRPERALEFFHLAPDLVVRVEIEQEL